MNKEEALDDFLKGLRISLNYIFLYSKGHRSFIKSVGELKKKIDILLDFLNPVKVGFAPDSLLIDGSVYKKALLHKELAKMFHLRKVKSIQIRQGITEEELVLFLDKIAMPPKEIWKVGGLSNVLSKTETLHFSVEDLDYSWLLKNEGEEVKDIWSFLLQDAVEKQNVQKVYELADNFEKNIGKFKASNFIENEELNRNIYRFLSFLKDKDKDKFSRCSRAMFKSVLKDKGVYQEGQLDKIRIFFQNLDEDDFANALWDAITTDDRFDSYSFQLFSQLVEKDKHEKIVSSLTKNVDKGKSLEIDPKIGKKIRELFSVTEKTFISEIYRRALFSLAQDDFSRQGISFDRELLQNNFCFTLLNLLAEEKSNEGLTLIAENMLKLWDEIIARKNPEYLKGLWEVLRKKEIYKLSTLKPLEELDKRLSNFIENMIWEEQVPSDFEYLIGNLEESSFEPDVYLQKIFFEDRVNPHILKLFFRFFPDKIQNFYNNLENKRSDIDFFDKIIKSLKVIDYGPTMQILKHIFSISGDMAKIEVLRAMGELREYDREFLFSVLKKGNNFLREEALLILIKDENSRKKALETLFCVACPLGRKNNILLENILILEELDLRWGSSYLIALSKKPFFWNRSLRRKAKEVLERWNVR
jgi:hypothetical protein